MHFSLAPLLKAAPVIQLHAFLALAALVVGAVQLIGPKGTLPHRVVGYLWAGLMLVIAASSLGIHTIRQFGPWSVIHILSVLVLVTVPVAVWRARRHQVQKHRSAMISLYVFALVVAGAFTLLPGRIMHDVFFAATR